VGKFAYPQKKPQVFDACGFFVLAEKWRVAEGDKN
jgi:hypothetical protein